MNRRTIAPLLLVLVVTAAVGSACDGGNNEGSASPPSTAEHESDDPIEAIVPLHSPGGILAARDFTTGPVAIAGNHLFWAAGHEESNDVVLLARNLATRETHVIGRDLSPLLGLASIDDRVIYAVHDSVGNRLVSTDFTGGDKRVLTNSLAAAFDARGDNVAWAEVDGSRQRVVALDLRSGRRLVALDAPRCRGKRCYRIDRVTVARDGVAFDLGAVGQGYPSLVARRSWGAARTELVAVPNDPQPDLVPSQDGAVYYVLRRGWMEWRFGEDQPRPLPTSARLWPLEARGDRRLAITGGVCKMRVGVIRGSTFTTLPAPRSAPTSPTQFGPLCRQVTGSAWSGDRVFLSWTITPKVSVEGHTEVGLSGVITSVRVP